MFTVTWWLRRWELAFVCRETRCLVLRSGTRHHKSDKHSGQYHRGLSLCVCVRQQYVTSEGVALVTSVHHSADLLQKTFRWDECITMERRKSACLRTNSLIRMTKDYSLGTEGIHSENIWFKCWKYKSTSSVKTDFLCRHVQVTIGDDFSPASITIYALEINIDQMNY